MTPDTTHTIRSTSRSVPAEAGAGVPLMTLVLSGALRVRRDGEEMSEPTRDAD